MRKIQGKWILVRVSKGSSFQIYESNVVNITTKSSEVVTR